eukprot:483501-Prymnesium_polylepis.1
MSARPCAVYMKWRAAALRLTESTVSPSAAPSAAGVHLPLWLQALAISDLSSKGRSIRSGKLGGGGAALVNMLRETRGRGV